MDTDFQQVVTFYDEQLSGTEWEETDRTEGTVEDLEVIETTWEGGTYIPSEVPQESAYEQARERIYLTVYELQPSGVGVDIRWTDNQLLEETFDEEGQDSEGDEPA